MISDGWERVYEYDGYSTHRYIYKWKTPEVAQAPDPTLGAAIRVRRADVSHYPPFSHTPEQDRNPDYWVHYSRVVQDKLTPSGGAPEWSGDPNSPGIVWAPGERKLHYRTERLITAPTPVSEDVVYDETYTMVYWSGGEAEAVEICVEASGAGFNGDEFGLPQAWAVGFEDFSTPMPSWVFKETPELFTFDSFGVMRFISNSLELDERSVAFSALGLSDKHLAAQDPLGSTYNYYAYGPPTDRMHATEWGDRRESTGDIFHAYQRPPSYSVLNNEENWGTVYNGYYDGRLRVRLDLHSRSQRPTITFNKYTSSNDGSEDRPYGWWTLAVYGLDGRRYNIEGTPFSLLLYSDPFYEDPLYPASNPIPSEVVLSTSNPPPGGWLHLRKSEFAYTVPETVFDIPGAAFVIFDLGWDEQEGDFVDFVTLGSTDPMTFPVCGTRSGIGGSVYTQGRKIKCANLANDGVFTLYDPTPD